MKRSVPLFGVTILLAGVTLAATTAPASAEPTSPVTLADAAIATHGADIRASAGDAYHVERVITDRDGASHVRYSRSYRGLRVYGGDFVMHNAAGGRYAGASSGLIAPLRLDTTARVPADAAIGTATKHFAGTVTGAGRPELFVDATSGTGRLAWETVVRGWALDRQTPSVLHVISDATTGAYIGSFDEIESVLGIGVGVYSGTVVLDTTLSNGLYQMTDPSHGNGFTCNMQYRTTGTCLPFTDADNMWGGANGGQQTAAVDAHYGAALTYDYYRNVRGRNGIFGNGAGVPSRVHYGNNYANAFWDGSQMTYGDGAGNARPLVSIDVAGHEMTHGVTAQIIPGGLNYSGESGGLNEATSDIFGTAVEFYANNSSDPGDYLIGEKININGNGTPLRYMYNPALDGASHSCWSTNTKNVNVHYSSGVANHFFFDLAEGTGTTPWGFSPTCLGAPGLTGIGRAKAETIWYYALDRYFTSTTQYVLPNNPGNTAIYATLAASRDLYGMCSTEYQKVLAAWSAVNVPQINMATCGGVITIRNINSGKCLEISDSSLDDGAIAQQWSCLGQPGMYWRIQTASNGLSTIVNVNSGKCLEISDSSLDDGEKAQQWSCLGQPGMYWTH